MVIDDEAVTETFAFPMEKHLRKSKHIIGKLRIKFD